MTFRTKEEVLEGIKILDQEVEKWDTYLKLQMQQMNDVISNDEFDNETKFGYIYSLANHFVDVYSHQYAKAQHDRHMWCNPLTMAWDFKSEEE